MDYQQIKEELLKYFPKKEDAIKALKRIGLSDTEIQERLSCSIPEPLIYYAAHRLIDDISGLSEIILDKFAKLLNVSDSRFAFKTEFLFRAVYFLRKKAYAQFVVEREGKKIQEISQTGIGVKSDVPELTNTMIRDIFATIIYTNADTSLINALLSKWKYTFEKLIDERSVSVLTPCSFNKPLNEYKTISDCVRGMLVYNTLIGQEYFKVGMKGFKVYSIGVDFSLLGLDTQTALERLRRLAKQIDFKPKNGNILNILNRITIPDDCEKIPDWIIIDKDQLMSKIFTEKVNEICQPLDIYVTHTDAIGLNDLL